MGEAGVRELKTKASELIRRVREDGEIIDITYYGEVVARLIPVNPPQPSDEEIAAVLTDLEELSAEISARWPKTVSALDAIHDVRRDL